MTDIAAALAEAGGPAAPATATAGLRRALTAELARGRAELLVPRSGYGLPVTLAFASVAGHLVAVLPLEASYRADPEVAPPRASLLAAAAVGALLDLGRPSVRAGEHDGHLVLAVPADPMTADELDELVPLAYEAQAEGIDRLRSRALAVPATVLADAADGLREPIGAGHPLRVAEAAAGLGGRPADARWVDEHEDEILARLGAGAREAARPHEDPDPARRIARRILQRLNGMGKWGGYHTDFAHLARGFAGNERALAQDVGEALLASGLLAEKPSVGQRHVFLNPRRAADIHAMIERGDPPRDLALPRVTKS